MISTSFSKTDIEHVIPGGVKWNGNGEGQIHCPYHEDKNPSCSINIDKETFFCHACDEKGKLSALLERCGGSPQSPGNTQYDYLDAEGILKYQAVRFYKDGQKCFYVRRPNGSGDWINNLKGVDFLPYHLPEITKGIKNGRPIFIVEGEKDADRLKALGAIATTNHGGSGKWKACHTKFLKGANVFLVGDYDIPGQAHVEKVGQSLVGIAKSIKVVDLGYEVAPEHGKDISDWLDSHNKTELKDLLKTAKPWKPTEKDFSSVAKKPGEEQIELISLESERTADIPPRVWFVDEMITTGFNLIIAKKAIGKSFFVMDMGFAISAGYDFMGQKTMQTGVLYIPTELDRIGVHERIQKYDLIPENFVVHYGWTTEDQALADTVKILERGDIRVIIFDMFLPIVPEIETNAYETSSVFLIWRKLAHKYEAAIIALWHAGKAVRNDFMDAAIGTTGLIGQSDSIISLERKRTESKGKLWIGGNHGIEQGHGVIFENTTWHRSGGLAEGYISDGDQQLINLVKERGKLRAIDAAALASRPYDSVRIMLAALHARELIDREGDRGPYIPAQTETTGIGTTESEPKLSFYSR